MLNNSAATDQLEGVFILDSSKLVGVTSKHRKRTQPVLIELIFYTRFNRLIDFLTLKLDRRTRE